MFVQPKNIKICLNGNNIKLMCATKKTSKDPQILHGVIILPCIDNLNARTKFWRHGLKMITLVIAR